MYRTHNCGQLRIEDVGKEISLAGWIQKKRDLGGMTFIDLRDRYGITQLVFNEQVSNEYKLDSIGRECVVSISGKVIERSSKNGNIPTGEIEIEVSSFEVLNESKVPPFTIEDESDGGDELRMQFRYLDIRRNPVKDSLILRHKIAQETRKYLSDQDFIEVETPVLIKSTPEGARDFVVPSRMNTGEFYALPQSPQTFKQLLMVAGMDKYFQIVKCFRDEDLRADRQPEFTQIDCELSFVERDDVLEVFEGMVKHLFKEIKGIELPDIPLMEYEDARKFYGSDKPDTRFNMKFVELNEVVKGIGFKVFDDAEFVVGINVPGCANYSRKQTDELIDFVKRPQIGASGLVYAKHNEDGSFKSSVDKFYDQDQLRRWSKAFGSNPGDLMLVMAGGKEHTRDALCELRLEMGSRLGLRDPNTFSPLWIVNFPLLHWDEESTRFHAMHHPFTSLLLEDKDKLESDPGSVRANAYDMVINGVELGGGSIRIHNKQLQNQMFKLLGFTEEEAREQFGFLMDAFEYGAPPHGGIAFGFDRICALFGGTDSIRDFIAFPKNNAGRDVMINSPSYLSDNQLDELGIGIREKV